MPGPTGRDVTAYKRSARQVTAGDYLPEYGAHAITDAMPDPDGGVWVTLEDGRDIRITVRKVWLYRTYALADWQRDAVRAYRDARDARYALRESGAPVPAGIVAGAGSASVAYFQLSDDDFRRVCPAPRLSDFLRAAADARRAPECVS